MFVGYLPCPYRLRCLVAASSGLVDSILYVDYHPSARFCPHSMCQLSASDHTISSSKVSSCSSIIFRLLTEVPCPKLHINYIYMYMYIKASLMQLQSL